MSDHGAERNIVFKVNDEFGSGPEMVREVFLEKGWVEHDQTRNEDDWNIWWKGSRFRPLDYEQVKPWQRLNHHPIPRGSTITCKDGLLRHMRRLRVAHGLIGHFSPLSFHLLREERIFKDEFMRNKDSKDGNQKNVWIYKPTDQSRGRGIFVFNDLGDLRYCNKSVVQQYLASPYLISGYKFDLRLYVIVVSFTPLVIYVCDEGIVRFSTEKYDMSSLDNVYSHLTNTSINKFGPSYGSEKVGVGAGCKWTLGALRSYLYGKGLHDRLMWTQIISIIILTLIGQAPEVPKATNCFELYGFDVFIDQHLKPWLLEVNFGPALTNDCATDTIAKKAMLNSLCDMLAFKKEDKKRKNSSGSKRCQSRGNDSDSGISSTMSQYQHSSRENSSLFSLEAIDETNGREHNSVMSRRKNESSKLDDLPSIPASRKVSLSFSRRLVRSNRTTQLRAIADKRNIPGPILGRRESSYTRPKLPPLSSVPVAMRRSSLPRSIAMRTGGSPSSSDSEGDQDDNTRFTIVGIATAQRASDKAAASMPMGDQLFGAFNCRQTLKNPPKGFGTFKLIYPFNQATRVATQTLDERKTVTELRRLLAHRQKETKERKLTANPGIWDVLDPWEPILKDRRF